MFYRCLLNAFFALISFTLLNRGYATVLQLTHHEKGITLHNSINTLTSSSSRQSCGVRGFDLGNPGFGCASFSNVLDGDAEATFQKIIEFLSSSPGSSDSDVSDIVSNVLLPLVSEIESTVKASPLQLNLNSPQDSNVCFGNFDSTKSFDDLEGVCGSLPLENEWTVLGFSLNAKLCPGISSASDFVSLCAAVNYNSCTTIGTPSVVLSMSTNLLQCGLPPTGSGGVSKSVFKAITNGLEMYTFGVSLSSSFSKQFNTFDGENVIKSFEAPGVILSSGTFELSTDALALPPVFAISGETTKLINIEGDAAGAKAFLNSFEGDAENGAEVLLRALARTRYSILYEISLQVTFVFSEFAALRKLAGEDSVLQFALPDSEEIELGRASVFATTYETSSGGTTLTPGVYVLATAAPGEAVKALINYIISFTGEVLDSVPGWRTPGFKVSDILSNLKLGGTGGGATKPGDDKDGFLAGFALRVPDARADLRVRVPLLIAALGFIEISCEIDLDEGSFSCSAETDIGLRIFSVAAVLAKDGVVFVAREVGSLGESALDASGPLLAAGSSALGDAADQLGSALSPETIGETAKAISNGVLDVSELGEVGLDASAWAITAGGRLDDVVEAVSEEVVSATRDVGARGKSIVDGLNDALSATNRVLSDALSSLSTGLECGVNAVEMAIMGNGGSCNSAVILFNALEDAGGDVVGAAEELGGNVVSEIGNLLSSIGNFLTGDMVIRVDKIDTGEIDNDTKCPIIEYIEVYKETNFPGLSSGSEKRRSFGKAADMECVKRKLQMVLDGEMAEVELEKQQKKLSEASDKYAACLKAASLTKDFLKTVSCKTDVQEERAIIRRVGGSLSVQPCTPQLNCAPGENFKTIIGKPRTIEYSIPVEVVCDVPVIRTDGSVGDVEAVSVFRLIDVKTVALSLSGVEQQVKEEIVQKLTSACPAD